MLLGPKPTRFDFFSALFPKIIRNIRVVPDDFYILIIAEFLEHFVDFESIVFVGDFDIGLRYVFERSPFYSISSIFERFFYLGEFGSISEHFRFASLDRIVFCRGFHDRHFERFRI